ncbi:hypothetical protein ACFWZY_29135 [Streptomyces sp. NPDC058992]|uniref:hypothetical protein n=1 Tax=Streptomyces sp. NPDC058992 TaxID=3346688 RepID=UPI00369F3AAA
MLRADGHVTAVDARHGRISWTKALPWPAMQEGSGPVAAGSRVLVPWWEPGGPLDAVTGRVVWISAARNDPGQDLANASQ